MGRINKALFHYKFHCFKNVHFKRLVDLTGGVTPPQLSIVHDVSDLRDMSTIASNLDDLDWLWDFDGSYQMYHSTLLNEKSFKYYKFPEDHFRTIPIGVATKLSKYRVENSKRLKVITALDGFKKTNEILNVINHKPILYFKQTGTMRQYKAVNHILSCVFDKIVQCPENYVHYIPIRISAKTYAKVDFNQILARGFNITTIGDENDPYFILLANLLTFIHHPDRHTPFHDLQAWDELKREELLKTMDVEDLEKIPPIMKRVSFLFHTDRHGCFYTIEDLKNLLENDSTIINKWLTQLGSIHHQDEEMEIVDPEVVNNLSEPEETRDVTIQVPADTGKIQEIDEQRSSMVKQVKSVINPLGISVQAAVAPPTNMDFPEASQKQPVRRVTPTRTNYTGPRERNDEYHEKLKVSSFVDEPTMRHIDEISKDYTPAQRESLIKKANAYKDITIDGRKLVDILSGTNGLKPVEGKDLSHLNGHVADPSFLENHVMDLDQEYCKHLLERDILMQTVSFNKTGMFLTDIKKEVVKNKMEDYTVYHLSFTDDKFKSHSFKTIIPNVKPDGTIISRGSVKKMFKQRFNKPICKIAPTRVALYSNYNKSLVQMAGPSRSSMVGQVNNLLLKKNPDGKIKFRQGRIADPKNVYPLELTQVASCYQWITIEDIQLSFDLKNIPYHEETGRWWLNPNRGFKRVFIDMDNVITIFDKDKLIKTTNLLAWMSEVLGVPEPQVNQWTELGVINKDIPVGIILAYKFGLEGMLKMLEVDYDTYETGTRSIPKDPDLIRVKLSDVTIVVKKYPLVNSLIVAGLNKFDLSKYSFMDLSDKEVYYSIFNNGKLSPSYLIEIDNFFNYFIDNDTHEVLVYMNEPTTVEGILIRATEMLTTMDHKQPSSVTNFRSRTHAKIPAILYNEMSKQLAASRRNNNSSGKFSINPQAVLQRVVGDALTENADINNPIGAIKDSTTFAYTGWGGRTPESFVMRDRVYADDAPGVVSEATVDSGNVAIRAQYSMDPSIVNLRGIEEPKPLEDVKTANLLSITGCLYPGASVDDGKRLNFLNIQMSQVIPVDNNQPSRVRTTFEKVVANLVKPPFAYMAEQDGKILDIDDTINMVKFEYKDGSLYTVNYGEIITRYSAAGMYINQRVAIHRNIKVGAKFKKGDPIVFNKDYFMEDPFSNHLIWMLGYRAKVALMDTDGTIDDSNIICKKLGAALKFHPIHDRQIVLSKDNVVHSFVDVGTNVNPLSVLMVFEEFEDQFTSEGKEYDEETMRVIKALNRSTPKAKNTGVVVDIKVTYTSPLKTMHPTMQKFISHVESKSNKQVKFSKGTGNELPPNEPITGLEKIGLVDVNEDTVIINYFIKDEYDSKAADKLVFGSSLKSVTSFVMDDSDYKTEDGSIEIDAVIPGLSVFNRMIPSTITLGTASMVLEALQKKLLEMYYG